MKDEGGLTHALFASGRGRFRFVRELNLDQVHLSTLGRPMPADQYRRQSSEAHQRGERTPDLSVKAGWERLAHEWLALAEQVELFERRYGNPDPAVPIPHPSQAVGQQQQQIQPKNEGE